jgi:hypothetical protein
MKNHSKYKITVLLLGLSLTGIAQSNSNVPVIKDTTYSVKGKFLVSGGIGASLILTRVYGTLSYYQTPYGVYQSPVYIGNIDYGLSRKIIIGAGVTYEKAEGVTFPYNYPDRTDTENFTRLNIAVRGLWDFIYTRNVIFYGGVRFGLSYWTDILTSPPKQGYVLYPTLGQSHTVYTSYQALLGLMVLVGPVGVNVEVAVGAPYFARCGLTFRI